MFILGGIIDGDQSFSVEVRKASNDPRGRFEKTKILHFRGGILSRRAGRLQTTCQR